MRNTLTLVGSALAALKGSTADANTQAAQSDLIALGTKDSTFATTLTAPLNGNVRNIYAGHRSHSSHSSHRSHYSGSGGGYRAPAPAPAPTPAAPQNYAPPSRSGGSSATPAQTLAPLEQTRPTADQLRMMIMRVQAGLYSQSYDPGAIDGELSTATKAALRKFQADKGLGVTGTITTATLNALGIALN
jgi:His-Xaa-Ser repeat protein HxsA